MSNPSVPPIPFFTADVRSLHTALVAMKEGIEVLSGQRGADAAALDTTHSHVIANILDLSDELAGKAAAAHTHTDLQAAITALEAAITALEAAITPLEAAVADLTTRVEALEAAVFPPST